MIMKPAEAVKSIILKGFLGSSFSICRPADRIR